MGHIDRTRVLVRLVDVARADGAFDSQTYRAIRQELAEYSPELAEKPEIIVLNKVDLVPEPDRPRVITEIADELAAATGSAETDGERAGALALLDAAAEREQRAAERIAGRPRSAR